MDTTLRSSWDMRSQSPKGEHNKKTKTGATRRVNNGKVLLYVPHDKWVKRLFSYNALKIKYDKQNGNKEVWEPVRRTRLLHLDDLEILNQYNAENSWIV